SYNSRTLLSPALPLVSSCYHPHRHLHSFPTRRSSDLASQLCNYAEKRAVEKDGHNLDIDYAKSQMKQTRELFSKNDGIQAHHVIQSFKPDEVTPEKANQVGLELAE